MNGKMQLKAFGGKSYTIFGGRYPEKPMGWFGVRCAEEIALPADVVVAIRDFGVPKDPVQLIAGLGRALDAIMGGEPVYVGCKGGQGRTGLFLACLAKLWGVKKPVEFVRATYYSHAVETKEQEQYVEHLKFPLWLRVRVFGAKLHGLGFGRKSLTVWNQEDVRPKEPLLKYQIP